MSGRRIDSGLSVFTLIGIWGFVLALVYFFSKMFPAGN